MSGDSDIAILGNAMKEKRRLTRQRHGVKCPRCREQRPKADATVLLPGQRCFDGHVDPRPRLTHEQHEAIWCEVGKRT